jgi:hypothetical protein
MAFLNLTAFLGVLTLTDIDGEILAYHNIPFLH